MTEKHVLTSKVYLCWTLANVLTKQSRHKQPSLVLIVSSTTTESRKENWISWTCNYSTIFWTPRSKDQLKFYENFTSPWAFPKLIRKRVFLINLIQLGGVYSRCKIQEQCFENWMAICRCWMDLQSNKALNHHCGITC